MHLYGEEGEAWTHPGRRWVIPARCRSSTRPSDARLVARVSERPPDGLRPTETTHPSLSVDPKRQLGRVWLVAAETGNLNAIAKGGESLRLLLLLLLLLGNASLAWSAVPGIWAATDRRPSLVVRCAMRCPRHQRRRLHLHRLRDPPPRSRGAA